MDENSINVVTLYVEYVLKQHLTAFPPVIIIIIIISIAVLPQADVSIFHKHFFFCTAFCSC